MWWRGVSRVMWSSSDCVLLPCGRGGGDGVRQWLDQREDSASRSGSDASDERWAIAITGCSGTSILKLEVVNTDRHPSTPLAPTRSTERNLLAQKSVEKI